jgi:ADP-heptose:LPS heptosyltransferase
MRILILNQNHIGDALFTTPAIAALRSGIPEATIVNAALPGTAPLFAANPHISIRWTRPQLRPRAMARFARRIRRFRFDAVISASASGVQFGAYALLSGAPIRIGFAHTATQRFFTHAIPIGSEVQHHVDDHLDQARVLAPGAARLPLELFPIPGGSAQWRSVRDALDLPVERPLVGLNPGASNAYKQWVPERWASLADRLAAQGLQPLLFGGPGDSARVVRIRAGARRPVPSTQGKLGLAGVAEAVSDCAVFVSGDTGPLHVAVAVHRPVVALHGHTDPARTGPYLGEGVTLYHPSPDGPGTMDSISTEEVEAAVEEVLSRSRVRP